VRNGEHRAAHGERHACRSYRVERRCFCRLLFVCREVLHDQLKLRMDLWDSMLTQEAAAGNKTSHTLLHATLDTLKQHQPVP
jgi:hypothetical protein